MDTTDDDANKAVSVGKHRRKLDQWLMDTFGRDWCGSSGPPTDNRKVYIHDGSVTRVFVTTNDGFEVGIGYPDEWHVIMRRKAALHLACFVFKIYLFDWFGLRSWIYYRALHHAVDGEWKLHPYPKYRKQVWISSYEKWEKEHTETQKWHDNEKLDESNRERIINYPIQYIPNEKEI